MSREDNLHLEKASFDHRNGVEAISADVYLGFDYLMAIYDQWVKIEEERPDLR